jgi:hypothetical protein
MLGVALADDANDAVPLDHFAVLADRLDAAADFHGRSTGNGKIAVKTLSIASAVA